VNRKRRGAEAVILKSEIYNFHRLDLTRQAGLLVHPQTSCPHAPVDETDA
jgi:hypothetical protein